MDAFTGVIDAKSPCTRDHSRRVAGYAVAAAGRLGFPDDRLTRLRRTALLHGIGKLGVSNSILDKPGPLTPAEWATMREHTRHTFEILDRVPVFREVAFDAARHHERLDGSGYHLGVTGTALAPSARVPAVADVTDALRSDRPYRAGLEIERVVRMLTADAAAGKPCAQSVAAMTCYGAETGHATGGVNRCWRPVVQSRRMPAGLAPRSATLRRRCTRCSRS